MRVAGGLSGPPRTPRRCSTTVLHCATEQFAVSTTTIRIEDKLKARVAAAAESQGKTPHAFILEAISRQVEQAEQDAEFHRAADERWAKVLASGKTVPWDKVRAYLEARSRGAKARRPAARKLGR